MLFWFLKEMKKLGYVNSEKLGYINFVLHMHQNFGARYIWEVRTVVHWSVGGPRDLHVHPHQTQEHFYEESGERLY